MKLSCVTVIMTVEISAMKNNVVRKCTNFFLREKKNGLSASLFELNDDSKDNAALSVENIKKKIKEK